MIDVKMILSDREKEIDLYFSHISSIEDTSDKILFKILKANILLMLYNLVEAIVSNSVDTIRNNIYNDSSTQFDYLKSQIKSQIIKDLKKNISPDAFVQSCRNISNDIIKLSFKKEDISKGNIDRNVIIRLSDTYGFNVQNSIYQETKHGETLTIIKERRNDLAHGTYSFSEIGKEYSISDIEKIKNQTIKYLYFVIQEIETYLNNKNYLELNNN